MQIEVTEVFLKILQAYNDGYRIFVLEGGSRSSKSWSIVDFINHLAKEHEGEEKRFNCFRIKFTWCEDTVYQTFKKNLVSKGLWDYRDSRQKPLRHRLHGNHIGFIGMDDPQRAHGLEQWFAWCEEGVEFSKQDFDQIEQRTSGIIVVSFNPTESQHWIFDTLLKRNDVFYIHSTMLDNPYISDSERKKILSYEPTPENEAQGTVDLYNWHVYGLGKRAAKKGRIFTNWDIIDEIPTEAKRLPTGIDFGFATSQAAVVDLWWYDNCLILDEVVYETGLIDESLADKVKELQLEWETLDYVADSAEPKAIRVLRNNGLRVYKAGTNGKDHEFSYNLLLKLKILITRHSSNAIYEFNNHRWKEDRHGISTNTPEDKFNHIIAGARYAYEWHSRILVFDSK